MVSHLLDDRRECGTHPSPGAAGVPLVCLAAPIADHGLPRIEPPLCVMDGPPRLLDGRAGQVGGGSPERRSASRNRSGSSTTPPGVTTPTSTGFATRRTSRAGTRTRMSWRTQKSHGALNRTWRTQNSRGALNLTWRSIHRPPCPPRCATTKLSAPRRTVRCATTNPARHEAAARTTAPGGPQKCPDGIRRRPGQSLARRSHRAGTARSVDSHEAGRAPRATAQRPSATLPWRDDTDPGPICRGRRSQVSSADSRARSRTGRVPGRVRRRGASRTSWRGGGEAEQQRRRRLATSSTAATCPDDSRR